MGKPPADEKNEPSLELPSLSLPGLKRRGERARAARPATAPEPEQPREDPTPADVPVGEPHPDQPLEDPTPADVPVGEPEPEARRALKVPTVTGRAAAALTGLVVGLAGAFATWGVMAGCEAVRGVSSCGGAPGFFLLLTVLALMVLLGSLLLRSLGVGDATSTSLLGVGIIAVAVMLVLIDAVFSVWMFAVVPVLGSLAYVLAHWVTTAFDDEPPRG